MPGANSRWLRAGRVLAGAALVAYPALVWVGLTHGSPRRLALVLLCVLLPVVVLRLRASASAGMRGLAALPLVTVIGLILAAALDASGCVLAVPVVINGLLLLGFGSTLRPNSVPMIERFARLQVPELPSEHREWCRLWTWIWCGFFVLNGGTALTLALVGPLAWWALYNGLVAYGLMGALFATEWILRRRRFGSTARVSAGRPSERHTHADARPRNERLAWEQPSESWSGGRTLRTFRTRIPEDYAFFAGHFPTYPVLAGAVQLHELVLPCLRRARPDTGALTQLTGVKFPQRILPGDDIEVRLGFEPDSSEVEFEISRGGVCCTQGRLTVALASRSPP